MKRQPPWHIKVASKDSVLEEFDVPAHKLGSREIGTLLRAIVVRHRTETAADMARYYVNNRQGAPSRLPFADIIHSWSEDHQHQGYLCGGWECYATAMQDIGPDAATIVREIFAQTKAASLSVTAGRLIARRLPG